MRNSATTVLATVMCLFVLADVNYPVVAPQSRLAVFALLGLVLCFMNKRVHAWLDAACAVLSAGVCGWIIVQTEPIFRSAWIDGVPLGERAGDEAMVDVVVGALGLILVIEAARRTVGWALPALSLLFLLYAWGGSTLPLWLFPHRGYGTERIVAQTFLHTQGVFGTALYVMCVFVFLFVVFGALLEATGATRFIVDFARRALGSGPGGPAKVAVLSSGLMGSLSGSAVANTATTGTFTIPLMKGAGFRAKTAGGIEAAASSGGALVPPVMGAGAYMMLEIVDPPVTYLEIIRAALLPAALYYFSLLAIVHLHARRIGLERGTTELERRPAGYEGVIFGGGIATLLVSLLSGLSVFRAASLSLGVVVLLASLHPRTRLAPKRFFAAISKAAMDAVPLVAAASCVGIVIGVVTLTGIGTKLPTAILGLSQGSLLAALVLIMVSSIVLGMGLPSVVCYLLMATLVGPVLSQLGVVPLAAHFFIFYFGMMSMVTPPVALAAYAAASIAGSRIFQTGLEAFRFALVGFTLPYMFVLRPELLMLDGDGGAAAWSKVATAVLLALLGIVAFAAGIAGQLFSRLPPAFRVAMFVAAALLLVPANLVLDAIGAAILAAVAIIDRLRR